MALRQTRRTRPRLASVVAVIAALALAGAGIPTGDFRLVLAAGAVTWLAVSGVTAYLLTARAVDPR